MSYVPCVSLQQMAPQSYNVDTGKVYSSHSALYFGESHPCCFFVVQDIDSLSPHTHTETFRRMTNCDRTKIFSPCVAKVENCSTALFRFISEAISTIDEEEIATVNSSSASEKLFFFFRDDEGRSANLSLLEKLEQERKEVTSFSRFVFQFF